MLWLAMPLVALFFLGFSWARRAGGAQLPADLGLGVRARRTAHYDLQRPSRCDGWTVADVLLHLAQTNEMAVASVDGTFSTKAERLSAGLAPVSSVDEWAGAVVDRERGDAEATRDRYLASAARAHLGLEPLPPFELPRAEEGETGRGGFACWAEAFATPWVGSDIPAANASALPRTVTL